MESAVAMVHVQLAISVLGVVSGYAMGDVECVSVAANVGSLGQGLQLGT